MTKQITEAVDGIRELKTLAAALRLEVCGGVIRFGGRAYSRDTSPDAWLILKESLTDAASRMTVEAEKVQLSLDQMQESVEVVASLRARVNQLEQEVQELKVSASANPSTEPKTIFNTLDEWFIWENLPEGYEERLQEFGDDLCVAVCTAEAWVDYVRSGKQDKLSYYGNDNGSQCISQIIDAVNDINAGLRVSGDPCNAVIIVKHVK